MTAAARLLRLAFVTLVVASCFVVTTSQQQQVYTPCGYAGARADCNGGGKLEPTLYFTVERRCSFLLEIKINSRTKNEFRSSFGNSTAYERVAAVDPNATVNTYYDYLKQMTTVLIVDEPADPGSAEIYAVLTLTPLSIANFTDVSNFTEESFRPYTTVFTTGLLATVNNNICKEASSSSSSSYGCYPWMAAALAFAPVAWILSA